VLLNAENNFVTDHALFLQPKSTCCRLVGELTEECIKGFAQFCVPEAKSCYRQVLPETSTAAQKAKPGIKHCCTKAKCNDLKNFINKTALINLENQYAAMKTIR